jgi:RNA recognition motif-containing protein
MIDKLYIGNIAWAATEDQLWDFFSQCGAVHNASIIVDRRTGRSLGYGFVEMDNAEEAMNTLNGAEFCGRPLNISEAKGRRGRNNE